MKGPDVSYEYSGEDYYTGIGWRETEYTNSPNMSTHKTQGSSYTVPPGLNDSVQIRFPSMCHK